MAELTLNSTLNLPSEVFKSSQIKDYFVGSYSTKGQEVISLLPQLLSSSPQLKEVIDPQKIYVAKFPAHIIEKISSGEYDIMKSKSGDLLSHIIDKTAPRKTVVHVLRLEEINPNQYQNVQNMLLNISNMAIQLQIADICAALSEINQTLNEVKEGQILDRIGLVNSGRNQIEQALRMKDASKRNTALQLAIQTLNDARDQLDINLRVSLQKMASLPSSKAGAFWKSLFDSKFYANCEKDYNDFENSLYAFIDASLLLSMAYSEIDERDTLIKVFQPTKTLITDSANIIRRLSLITCTGPIPSNPLWYYEPDNVLNAIDLYQQNIASNVLDNISIEIKGAELVKKEWS